MSAVSASLRQQGVASSSGRPAALCSPHAALNALVQRPRPQRLVCSASAGAYTDTFGTHPSPGALSPPASYDLLGRSRRANALARSDTAWFQTAVNAIVRRVSTNAMATSSSAVSSSTNSSSTSAGSTPFLQLVNRRPEVLGGPQLSSMQLTDKAAWAAAARQLSTMPADCVVLVQPVENAESACVTGCERMQHASEAPGSSSPRSEYSGRVGDCCDGSGSEHDHSHMHHSCNGSGRNISSHGSSGGSDDTTGYWGLVVQCRGADTQHVAGCYLLKTVRSSSDPGCQCTHWSVTRVCQNAPLQQQLRRSWLAA